MFSNLDLNILNISNNIQNPILDSIMLFLTFLANDGLIWVVFILALSFFKNTRIYGFLVFISLGMTLLLGNKILKNFFDRERPFLRFSNLRLLVESSGTNSFPSSHAATAFAVFGVFYFFNLKYKWYVFILALSISLSRVYLNLHYFSDITAGAALGLIVSYTIFLVSSSIRYFRNPVTKKVI